MKGLELARRFWESCGAPVLERDFPDLLPKIAVGLCGSGSECFGYDDEVSRDHDFEPGFCLFLPGEDEVDRRTAFLLERAYAALPKEFGGFTRERMSPVGGNRHGVIRAADFFLSKCGSPDGELSLFEWLRVPESALAEAVNGEIFRDDGGAFTHVREKLAAMPEDIVKKRLAGQLVRLKQAGPYNYPRALAHGETAAAQLSAVEFTDAAMRAVFLLNRRYMPYYKWSFRALRELETLSSLADSFEYLLCSDNGEDAAKTKLAVIGDICALLAAEVRRQGFADPTSTADDDPEALGYAVNAGIRDGEVRALHIFAGV